MAALTHAPELESILRTQEMRGERVVNHIRMGFYLLSAMTLAGIYQVNTPIASQLFVVQIGSGLLYSLCLYFWFRSRGNEYAPWLKYLSITVDITLLQFSAIAVSVNHYGIIEYFHSLIPLVLVLWNLLSALRYSVVACLYSGTLCMLTSSLVLFYTVAGGLVEISEISVWGEQAINIADESTRIMFIALPGYVAAVIARISRNLIVRAEEESLSRLKAEQQKDQLSRYVSKGIAEYIFQDPERVKLGGTRREATVFFSDIRNFTPLSEQSEPEEVVTLLNEYFTEMVGIVFKYGGTLDKFLGDGLMALFGVPFDVRDGPVRAVLCGLEMMQAVKGFNERHLKDWDIPPLKIGIGIATGPVVAGNIGSEERMEYTVIGDTVNFAARLEGLNRDLGTSIIVSESTREALGDHFPVKKLMPLKVKGKKGTPPLYAIIVDKVTPEQIAALREVVLAEDPGQDL